MSVPSAGEEEVEEVWTPKAAAAAALQQQQQPKSSKFAALSGGIALTGAKSDDNMQPCPPFHEPNPPSPPLLPPALQVRRNSPEQRRCAC